jgi:Holliday junction resolvase RusA-like endonuclease
MFKRFVPGEPLPGGSKRILRHGDKVWLADANKNVDLWKAHVRRHCQFAMRGQQLMLGPLGFEMTFIQARPQDHYRTGRYAHLLRPKAPPAPDVMPDLTKLVRAVEDALTGVVWKDDGQVVDQVNRKRYGTRSGVFILVVPWSDDRPLFHEEDYRELFEQLGPKELV